MKRFLCLFMSILLLINVNVADCLSMVVKAQEIESEVQEKQVVNRYTVLVGLDAKSYDSDSIYPIFSL